MLLWFMKNVDMMASSADRTSNLNPGRLVIAYDATKDRNCQEIRDIVADIMTRDGMIQEVDTITVLGVLHRVMHPMGFQMQIGPDAFMGTQIRAIKEEVSRKVGTCLRALQKNAVECGEQGVTIEVRTVVGAPLKKVVVHEVEASNATWVVLDRYLRKDLKFYLKHIPSKFALVLDNLSLDILRPYFSDKVTGNIEHKLLYSLSRNVPLAPVESSLADVSTSSQASGDSDKSSLVSSLTSKSKEPSVSSPDDYGSSPSLELGPSPLPHELGSYGKVKSIYDDSLPVMEERRSITSTPEAADLIATEAKSEPNTALHTSPDVQVADDDLQGKENCGLPMDSDEQVPRPHGTTGGPLKYSYSDIQNATDGFSFDNILGEGGYGIVYKGQLKDGELITVKVQKEESKQAMSEFHSQIHPLRYVLHGNISMLLGYCWEENIRILVYEYISNKSLEWHLFDTRNVLEWKHRHSIAIRTGKALRFLHEECRGNPIIHQDVRPSNILLTHDFIPMLGDCGLAKWRTNKCIVRTKARETLVYRAPEYLENGICTQKTDVFAFGIVLIQLISGRMAVDPTRRTEQSLGQWALPLIQNLALEELVDPRLGHSYSTYEMYLMSKAAYLCIQTKPSMRPTMGEVLLLLEGKNDHLRLLTDQLVRHQNNV